MFCPGRKGQTTSTAFGPYIFSSTFSHPPFHPNTCCPSKQSASRLIKYFSSLLLWFKDFLMQLASHWAKDAPCFSSCAIHLEPRNPHLIILMPGSDIHLLFMSTICMKNGSSPRPFSLFPNPCQQQEEAMEYQCSLGLWLLAQELVVL